MDVSRNVANQMAAVYEKFDVKQTLMTLKYRSRSSAVLSPETCVISY